MLLKQFLFSIFPLPFLALVILCSKLTHADNIPKFTGRNVMNFYLNNHKDFKTPCYPSFRTNSPFVIKNKYKEDSFDFMNSYINSFIVNTDSKTAEYLTYVMQSFFNVQNNQKCPEITPSTKYHNTEFQKESPIFKEKYSYLELDAQESLYYVHGLRFANPKIREYVKTKDMMDIGAYIGDSAIVLSDYTDGKVYSYEISPKLVSIINQNVKKGNKEGNVVVINKGISEKRSVMYINDVASPAGSLNYKGRLGINISSIDDETFERDLNLGFIKADIEGYGLKALLGGDKAIRKFRPVLFISVYHCYEEMFLIPEYIRTIPNYIIDFIPERSINGFNFAYFAYPAEAIYPIGYLNISY